MGRRLDLHHALKDAFREATGLDPEGRVFFQPPASQKLHYPCILYKLDQIPAEHANNLPYKIDHQYELTVIDPDPLSPLRERIVRMPQCRFIRPYTSDNLHHYVFQIYD